VREAERAVKLRVPCIACSLYRGPACATNHWSRRSTRPIGVQSCATSRRNFSGPRHTLRTFGARIHHQPGHDGLIDGQIINDATGGVCWLKKRCAYVRSRCDIIAPSDMMDGGSVFICLTIRAGLDAAGFLDVLDLSYAAKYASAFTDRPYDASARP